jgi:hypothetical protein
MACCVATWRAALQHGVLSCNMVCCIATWSAALQHGGCIATWSAALQHGVLQVMPSAAGSDLIVCGEGFDVKSLRRQGDAQCVSHEWLIESVCQHSWADSARFSID